MALDYYVPYYVYGECSNVSSINDKNDWKTVKNALSVIDFDASDTEHLFGIIASVLHLGNVHFDGDTKGYAILNSNAALRWLLGIHVQVLHEALTFRKIEAKSEEVLSPFTVDLAICARDALAKAIYGRAFTWLVNRINESLENKDSERKTVIGLLDIYGFEVFSVNSHKLADKKTRKSLERGDFRLLHYAGEVTYCIVGFIDKNNDLLYKNIKDVMRLSKNPIIQECFPATEGDSRRRPETVATQFKNSLLRLTEILTAKEAWYVRCLKSNDNKQSGKFDEVLVRHQVKYLGLMEHLRVRRAGFAYRRRYEVFLQRYKALCPATWPHWRGVPAEGVEKLVQHLGYKPDEYKMDRTKIFIRYARTLFATEDAFEICKHELATRIQAKYKGYKAKGEFRKQKEAATKIETCWRGVQARKERDRRAWAVKIIKQFIKGYITRREAKTTDNSEYLAFVRQSYLNRLKDNLPKTVLDKTTWLTPPPVMTETSEILRQLNTRMMVRKYVQGITPQKKAQLQQKVVTSAIFKGNKDSYPSSIAVSFVDTRINEQDINMRILQTIRHERIKYSVPVVKYDRNGFKSRPRQLVLTQAAVYLVEEAKIKQRVDYVSLKGASVSNLGDSVMILHVALNDPKQKGDLVLQCDHLFEALTKLAMIANKQNNIKVVQGSIKFEIQAGKEGGVDFSTAQEPMIFKGKNGHLMVVSDYFSISA
ncbi:hypothetical protein cypCar_00034826 [Cyprinus carpio]|nr:hypothetical protein cypCar_00034826 [Cyprinus carpio]